MCNFQKFSRDYTIPDLGRPECTSAQADGGWTSFAEYRRLLNSQHLLLRITTQQMDRPNCDQSRLKHLVSTVVHPTLQCITIPNGIPMSCKGTHVKSLISCTRGTHPHQPGIGSISFACWFFADPKFSVVNPTFLFFFSAEIPFNLLENEKIVW